MLLSISPLGLEILNKDLQSIIGKDIKEVIPGAEKFLEKEFNDIKEKDTISFLKDSDEKMFDINLTPLIEYNKSVTGKIFILCS